MHLTLLVPAPFSTISGGYAYDRRMVAGLSALGHVVDVIELPGSYPLADTAAQDAACSSLDALPSDTKPLIDGLALPAFAGLEDALAARGVIGLIHHPTSMETGLGETAQIAQREIERRLFRRIKRLIVTSDFTAEQLTNGFGVRAETIAVVVPGSDSAPRSAGSGSDTCKILSVGSLVPRKGHDLLLHALARLFDLDWHLTVAGPPDREGVHARGLRALAEELGIAQRVDFAGAVTGDRLEALWQSADLFALATYFEGYGMAIAEALKRGLPVAVTAGGAAGALVGPEAGTVCPPGDRDQLSKSLRRLIFSRDLRKYMSDLAWQTGQSLPSWEKQAVLLAKAIA